MDSSTRLCWLLLCVGTWCVDPPTLLLLLGCCCLLPAVSCKNATRLQFYDLNFNPNNDLRPHFQLNDGNVGVYLQDLALEGDYALGKCWPVCCRWPETGYC